MHVAIRKAVDVVIVDLEGKLTRVVGPANLSAQRYTLDYTYDTVVRVHVESVTDSFGYRSNATHNFKFAEITSANKPIALTFKPDLASQACNRMSSRYNGRPELKPRNSRISIWRFR